MRSLSTTWAWATTLYKNTPDAEKMRVMQAPNRKDVWTRSQMPREMAMSGPRFEQTIMEVQVWHISFELGLSI